MGKDKKKAEGNKPTKAVVVAPKPPPAESTGGSVSPELQAKLDRLKQARKEAQAKEAKDRKEPVPVSQGAVERVLDLALNASREKLREVTIVDRLQGRLLPALDMISSVWEYVIELAAFRDDAELYKEVFDRERPIPPNVIDDFVYRMAQWQKSIGGKNLQSAMDLALADMETRGEDEEKLGSDAWKD